MDTSRQSDRPHAVRAHTVISAFISGGAVMAMELMGSRLLAPVVGVTLAVWTALIAVTLVFLSLGYLLGGHLPGQMRRGLVLSVAMAAAGLHCLLVPDWSSGICTLLTSWDVRTAAVAGATLVLALPSLLLGIVAPLAADILGQTPGRATGSIFAASTLGGVAGTVLTGYVLVPTCGLRAGFAWTSCALLILSITGFAIHSHRRTLIVAGTLILAGIGCKLVFTRPSLKDGQAIFDKQGLYGRVTVVDTEGGRYLMVNRTVQSFRPAGSRGRGSLLQSSNLAGLVPILRPKARKCCTVGLGSGLIAESLSESGLEVIGVEIDPAVLEAARAHFGFKGRAVVADGRAFLSRCLERFDVVLVDAYASETLPFHLFTQEAFEIARHHLQPAGLLVMHIVARPRSPAVAAVSATLRSVFPEVRIFAAEEQLGPVWLFASDAPLPLRGAAVAEKNAERLVTNELRPGSGRILTDNRNGLDHLYAEDARAFRAAFTRFREESSRN